MTLGQAIRPLKVRRHPATSRASEAWKGSPRPTLYSVAADPETGCWHCGEDLPCRIYAFAPADLPSDPDDRFMVEAYCSIHCLGQRWT